MKKIISVILVILWMILIFLLSNIKGEESHDKSVGGIKNVITTTYTITDKTGITKDKSLDEKGINKLSEKLNYPIRKFLHFFEYFILTILLCNMFKQYNIKDKRMIIYSLGICFLYACSDELHQIFRERTSKFTDVLIDTSGGIVASLLIMLLKKKRILK